MDERVTAGAAKVVGPSGKGIHVAPVLHRITCRHERTALAFGFHHYYGACEGGDNPVAAQEVQGHRRCPGRVVRHQAAPRHPYHLHRQALMLPGVHFVDTRGQHANGGEAALQGCLVGDAIGPQRHAAHDARLHLGPRQPFHQFPAPGTSVGAEVARAYDAHHRVHLENLCGRGAPVQVKAQRRVRNLPQRGGVVRVRVPQKAEALLADAGEFPLRPLQHGGNQPGKQLRMRCPVGAGYDAVEKRPGASRLLHKGHRQPGMVPENLVQRTQRHLFIKFHHGAKVMHKNEKQRNRLKDCVVSHVFSAVSTDSVKKITQLKGRLRRGRTCSLP